MTKLAFLLSLLFICVITGKAFERSKLPPKIKKYALDCIQSLIQHLENIISRS